MCGGCWVGQNSCGARNVNAYAHPPVDGVPHGQMGTEPDSALSKEEARISVAWCAEQMKGASDCSTEYIGVSKGNGHCWCAKAGTSCSSGDLNYVTDTVNGGFFRSKLEAHSLAHLLHARCLTRKH